MTQQIQAARLDVVSLGLAFGIMWALGVFILGIMAAAADWGTEIVVLMSSVYLGFDPSFVGSLIGAAWGFVDGGVGGMLIAWLYNVILARRQAARD